MVSGTTLPTDGSRIVIDFIRTGDVGAQGPQGVTGTTGSQGPTGNVGPQGPNGPQGVTGPQGPNGPQGPTGVQGPQGNQGTAGAFSTGSNAQVNSLGVGVAATGTAGQIVATNDITAHYSSDDRLKTNKRVIENALSMLDNVNGYYFEWNDIGRQLYPDRTKVDVGVIAQEINTVLPEVVVLRNNGYYAVSYEKIIALLIQAIKELNDKIK